MNMVRVYEFILIIVVVSFMDIGHAMKSSGRDSKIVMIPTPGHPNNPLPPGPSSTSQPQSANQPNPDEILGYVFDEINRYADSTLATLWDHLRSDRWIMNGNALRTELMDRCAVVFGTSQTQMKGYLVLACRFLTVYVSVPLLTISFTNVEIYPYDNGIIRDMFDYLFKQKKTMFRDKVRYGREKIPETHENYISNKCRQILGNIANRMVWQVVGCDFITVYGEKNFGRKQ